MNYQEKVSTRADVRALFEKVKSDPGISRYRGYTETRSYGWDEAANDYVKCEGEAWFDNPAHDKNLAASVAVAAENDEPLDEELGEQISDQISEQVSEPFDVQLAARDAVIAQLSEECDALRKRTGELEAQLFATNAECQAAVEKKNAAVSILCHLREVLEAVLAYKSE